MCVKCSACQLCGSPTCADGESHSDGAQSGSSLDLCVVCVLCSAMLCGMRTRVVHCCVLVLNSKSGDVVVVGHSLNLKYAVQSSIARVRNASGRGLVLHRRRCRRRRCANMERYTFIARAATRVLSDVIATPADEHLELLPVRLHAQASCRVSTVRDTRNRKVNASTQLAQL